MKSVLENKKSGEQVHKYPYLGEFPNGDVVLFAAKDAGVLVYTPNKFKLHYSECWAEHCAKPLKGRIILSND